MSDCGCSHRRKFSESEIFSIPVIHLVALEPMTKGNKVEEGTLADARIHDTMTVLSEA